MSLSKNGKCKASVTFLSVGLVLAGAKASMAVPVITSVAVGNVAAATAGGHGSHSGEKPFSCSSYLARPEVASGLAEMERKVKSENHASATGQVLALAAGLISAGAFFTLFALMGPPGWFALSFLSLAGSMFAGVGFTYKNQETSQQLKCLQAAIAQNRNVNVALPLAMSSQRRLPAMNPSTLSNTQKDSVKSDSTVQKSSSAK